MFYGFYCEQFWSETLETSFTFATQNVREPNLQQNSLEAHCENLFVADNLLKMIHESFFPVKIVQWSFFCSKAT